MKSLSKKLSNVYEYEVKVIGYEDKLKLDYEYTNLKALRNGRWYNTKMTKYDLPETYCDVQRYYCHRNLVNTKGVTDLLYTWVKENHFMKDSQLRISYGDKIEKYYPVFNIDGVETVSKWPDYNNTDISVWGHDILDVLKHIHKYSPDVDLSEIKKSFIEQCEWLKENEPEFAPDDDDFGEWFDDKITWKKGDK